MDLRLTGRVFVVTGASAGIGAATARVLAEEGANVLGVARKAPDDSGDRITGLAADVTDPDAARVDYAAAKTAPLSVSKALAGEYGGHGIRSTIVTPGPTRTRLWDEPGGFADQLAEGAEWAVDGGALRQL